MFIVDSHRMILDLMVYAWKFNTWSWPFFVTLLRSLKKSVLDSGVFWTGSSLDWLVVDLARLDSLRLFFRPVAALL